MLLNLTTKALRFSATLQTAPLWRQVSKTLAAETKMNPKKFGQLTNHKLEPWKVPLPVFIEDFF